MSAVESGSSAKQTISLEEVRALRQCAIANGYRPVTVRSCSKAPLMRNWQHGEDPTSLLDVRPEALNTGLLLAGFRCIDLDIDDPQLALEVVRLARQHLPPGALIRRRANSSRLAMLYRAAEGQPPKRVVKGPRGKVEILGLGQQVVVHGLHPSGARITWQNGRGPDTVPHHQVPAVSEDEISAFLDACTPLLGVNVPEPEIAGASLRGPSPSGFLATALPPAFADRPDYLKGAIVEDDLGAGIQPRNWFSELPAEEKSKLVKACLDGLDNRRNDPRDVWLQVLFGVADAERLGCPDARQLALKWSQGGASWTSEADFDRTYNSYKPKPGGITVGSLLAMAADAGLDLSPWRDAALAGPGSLPLQSTPAATPIDLYSFLTIDPDQMPPHRPWSVGTKIIEGEVTILAAKGGWGKSAYSISTACSAASGRDFLNLKIWGGPKQVLYVNSEDDTDELRRRFIAAAQHHKLTKADLARIMVRGVNTPGHETLTTGDESAPRMNEAGFAALDAIITKAEPDIVILDPLGTFCPAGLNHNGVMSQLLLHLKRLAKMHACGVLLVHHTRKDGDLINTDAIGGASAIVNQARVAMMLTRMTAEEAKNFKGILSSETWRYFRIVDAKTNLAPPASDAQWYQLVSHELPNAAPPTYLDGDGVQVVEKVNPIQLNVSPATSAMDNAAKLAILKAAHAADPPFSPSSRGGSNRYIIRHVLDQVRQATGLHWGDRDMIKHIEALVREMMSAGWLRVEEVKVGANKRQGITVNPASTPWPLEFDKTGSSSNQLPIPPARQIHQMPIKTFEGNGSEGIDARRPEGASNVPKGCGDLTGPVFDAAQPPSAPAEPALAPADVGLAPNPPAAPACPSPMPSPPVAISVPTDNADDLDIPTFLRRAPTAAKPRDRSHS